MNLQHIFNQQIRNRQGQGFAMIKAFQEYCRTLRDGTTDESIFHELNSLRLENGQALRFSQEISDHTWQYIQLNLGMLDFIIDEWANKIELEKTLETGGMSQKEKGEYYRAKFEEKNQEITKKLNENGFNWE